MKKKWIIVAIIFILIMFFYVILKSTNLVTLEIEVKRMIYGEAINNNGTINNEFFNISSEGKKAKSTTYGINKAIQYAYNNNIEYIKLEKGIYLIDGVKNEYNEKKGIIMQDNIKLDLNGSTIIQEANSSERYSMISIYENKNVQIYNGIVIGDKENHSYDDQSTTYEWGHGIDIRSSVDISINNLLISEMIGDRHIY